MSEGKKVVAVPLEKLEALLNDLEVDDAGQVKGGTASVVAPTELGSMNARLTSNQASTGLLNTQTPKPTLLDKLRVAASTWRVVV